MSLTIDRINQPARIGIQKMNVPQAKKYTLDNGIEVYAINAGFQELVKVELLFNNVDFDPNKPLLNSATNRMMSEGTRNFSAQQIADMIDYYGSFYETDENSDFCSIILYSLNKYLKDTLPFVSAVLEEPVFPEKELAIFKQNNKQRLNVDNEKVGSMARKKFGEIIFGSEHPYGYFIKPENYDSLTSDDLKAFHAKKYSPSNCMIIVSGLVTDETIMILNRFLGQRKTSGEKIRTVYPKFVTSTQKQHYIEKEGAIQSAIRIGMPFFNRKHPDYAGTAVMNTLFGGYFGSRLMSNIREDKGYTYGIGSVIVSMKQEGYYFISTEVGADVTNDAIKEIYNEVDIMRNELVEEEELEMVKNYMLGTFLKGIDGAFQLAERFKSIYLSELDYTYYERYVDKLRTIGPDEILELSRKYLDPAHFLELVVGRK
jgi:zinc protease